MAWTASSILGPSVANIVSSQVLNDPSLGGFGPTPGRGPVAGVTVAPPINLPQTPAQRRREELRSRMINDPSLMGSTGAAPRPGFQQVGSSVPVPGGSSKPNFLNNPSAVLNEALIPYEELLSRIFAPPAATNTIPPVLARAYAAQANANTARINQQIAAQQAVAQLPARLAEARAREQAMAPWSLAGLPTGLGYQDPASAARNNSFDIQAMMLNPRTSGWTPAFPLF